MHENTESPEDVDRQLATARRILQDFEDGVDRQRLLLRLRTASPAHPVLLFRFGFAASVVLLVTAAILVMVVTQVNSDLARILARFEQVLPLPEEIPALPAVLGLLAMFMGLGWLMATLAALALGRDAQMLPWEQKQHQKLVNEVTRLTTQKAVMERIRNTPAGARPRIATPVPVGARRAIPTALTREPVTRPVGDPSTVPLASVSPAMGLRGGGMSRGGIGRTPSAGTSYTPPPSLAPPRPTATPGPMPASPGGFGVRAAPNRSSNPLPTPVATPLPAPIRPPGAIGRSAAVGMPALVGAHRTPVPAPTAVRPSDNRLPDNRLPDGRTPVIGAQVRMSGPSTGVSRTPSPAPAEPRSDEGGRTRPAIVLPSVSQKVPAPSGGATNGAMAGIRLGASSSTAPQAATHADSDPDEETLLHDDPEPEESVPAGGILGRGRAGAPLASRSTPYGSAGRVRLPPSPATLRLGTAQPSLGQSTRGGTPLGAPPKAGVPVGQAKPRLAPPLGFPPPSTPRPAERAPEAHAGASMFATPFPSGRSVAALPPAADEVLIEESVSDPITAEIVLLDDEDEDRYGSDEAPTTLSRTTSGSRDVPTVELDSGEDAWLADALVKADALMRSFPPQATLELSREPNLPFTLVISRATPAMAVRAMVNFVEFLASIATPPRARIELLGVAHLDRSFHKNVEAALEPYFGGNLEVRPGPGQVDIRFTDPDPQWGAYPRLPR